MAEMKDIKVSFIDWVWRTILRVIIFTVLLFGAYWVLKGWSTSREIFSILLKDGIWWGLLYYAGLMILCNLAEDFIGCIFNTYSKRCYVKIDNMRKKGC